MCETWVFIMGQKKLPTSTGWVRENHRPKQELQQDPLRGTSKAQRNLRVCLELHGHQQIVGPFWRYSQFQDFCWTCKKSHGTNAILWHCSVFYGETTRRVPTRYPPVQPKKRNVWQLRVAKGLDDWNKFQEPGLPLR